MPSGADSLLLKAAGLRKRYGGVHAVDGFDLELSAGQIAGLIGPNGAGKTTVFNIITGLDSPDAGSVHLAGRDITRRPAHRISRMGIARTFQNIRLLGHMSVLDNVKIACHRHARYGLATALLRTPPFRRRELEIAERALSCLRLFGLEAWADEPAAALPYGRQRKLEVARALATEAKLLLLDEPAAGLNPQETAELAGLIRGLRDRFGVTILLIEHDMRMVMSLCEWVEVLDHGRVIARGTPQEVKSNERVIEAYLGRPKAKETK